jgi:hypothetical protein
MNFQIKRVKRVKRVLISVCMILAAAGCEKMNDKHKPYLENGEIAYIGKVDSLKAFAGDERILFQYWISDPRVKALHISWALGKESVEIPVPAHLPAEPFELYIGKNEKNIAEGNYTFNWVSLDHHGNRSIIFETAANVYGQRYKSRLLDRPLISASVEEHGTDVTLTLGGITDDDEVGVNVSYTTTSDVDVTIRYKSNEATSAVIPDVKLTAPVTYSTLYIPEPGAIDTFSTVSPKVDIMSLVNVVLNKPVTHSDANAGNQGGDMTVDGDKTIASRWVSDNSHNAHWIEVDLQGSFSINGFRMWRDQSNATQKMKQFSLQAWINDEWADIFSEDNNEAAEYYKEFENVTTGKVRLYIPPYNDNRTRLIEIEVYSIIKY